MSARPRVAALTSAIALGTLAGCAVRTPERAAVRFTHQFDRGATHSTGVAAFDQTRAALRLTENPPKQGTDPVYHKSASWSRGKLQIGLASSDILKDAPARFDLLLSWYPPRTLQPGLLEKLLGRPAGLTATWDSAWILGGGVLEYRATATEVPYLLFSSPGYIRDPLDFVESAALPRLPQLSSVTAWLDHNASGQSPKRSEIAGIESQEFQLTAERSITVYTAPAPDRSRYLIGLALTLPGIAPDFVPLLADLGISSPRQLAAAILDAPASSPFAASGNFALALTRATSTRLTIWRRIESPRSWCEHLRPDLERCSATLPTRNLAGWQHPGNVLFF